MAILLRNWVENSDIYMCGNNMILRLASEASHLWFAFARCQGSFCLRKKPLPMLYAKAIKKDIKLGNRHTLGKGNWVME